MKAIDMIGAILENCLDNTKAVRAKLADTPDEDLITIIGDYRTATPLKQHAECLLLWVDIDSVPCLGNPDAIVIPEEDPQTQYICIYYID